MNAVLNITLDLGSVTVTIAGATVTGSATVSTPVDRSDLMALLSARDAITLPAALASADNSTAKPRAPRGRVISDDEFRNAIEGTPSLAAAAAMLKVAVTRVIDAMNRLGIPARQAGIPDNKRLAVVKKPTSYTAQPKKSVIVRKLAAWADEDILRAIVDAPTLAATCTALGVSTPTVYDEIKRLGYKGLRDIREQNRKERVRVDTAPTFLPGLHA